MNCYGFSTQEKYRVKKYSLMFQNKLKRSLFFYLKKLKIILILLKKLGPSKLKA